MIKKNRSLEVRWAPFAILMLLVSGCFSTHSQTITLNETGNPINTGRVGVKKFGSQLSLVYSGGSIAKANASDIELGTFMAACDKSLRDTKYEYEYPELKQMPLNINLEGSYVPGSLRFREAALNQNGLALVEVSRNTYLVRLASRYITGE